VVNGWWLAGKAVGILFPMIPSWRIAYRYGIRDGAFNHHLPIVRREMVFYDERRAKAIFEAEDDGVREVSETESRLGVVASGRCGSSQSGDGP
jgi:hypothetical protein